MKRYHFIFPLIILAIATACKEEAVPYTHLDGKGSGEVLATVGSVKIYQSDLNHYLKEKYSERDDETVREAALKELIEQARFTAAALNEGLDKDPAVRAELARLLRSRLRETVLFPEVKESGKPVPEPRLRELYGQQKERYQANEKRQIAVLWLNPNGSPERTAKYREKLDSAKAWVAGNEKLRKNPQEGFSVLSIDHSEHQASRYKGGILDWIEANSGMDAWTRAVAEIAFSLKVPGDVSEVIDGPEGIFLVRLVGLKPATQRPFESVASELERAERSRLREIVESEFEVSIRNEYPATIPNQ